MKTPSQISQALQMLTLDLELGCGNHGCRISQPKGMGTNSVCTCDPRRIANALLSLAIECEKHGKQWRTKMKANKLKRRVYRGWLEPYALAKPGEFNGHIPLFQKRGAPGQRKAKVTVEWEEK